MTRRYVLDTNVLIHIADQADGWEQIVHKMDAAGKENLILSAVTAWEIFRQVARAKLKKRVLHAAVEMLSIFKVESLSGQMAALGGSNHGTLMNRGIAFGEQDSMIAATVMSLDCVMVSDDRLFAAVPGITLENWRVT